MGQSFGLNTEGKPVPSWTFAQQVQEEVPVRGGARSDVRMHRVLREASCTSPQQVLQEAPVQTRLGASSEGHVH